MVKGHHPAQDIEHDHDVLYVHFISQLCLKYLVTVDLYCNMDSTVVVYINGYGMWDWWENSTEHAAKVVLQRLDNSRKGQ